MRCTAPSRSTRNSLRVRAFLHSPAKRWKRSIGPAEMVGKKKRNIEKSSVPGRAMTLSRKQNTTSNARNVMYEIPRKPNSFLGDMTGKNLDAESGKSDTATAT